MLRVLPATFKPIIQQRWLLKAAKLCCRKEGVVLLFETKSSHAERFAGPRQTCFAVSDVTPVYGVTSV